MKRPWWQQEVTIAWAMMLVFPIGILMMWLYAPWRKRFKWVWTGVAVFAALMIIGGVFGDDSGKSTSSDTALVVTESSTKNTKTKEPTSTPKPTATEEPTDTPEPTAQGGEESVNDWRMVYIGEVDYVLDGCKEYRSTAEKELINCRSYARNIANLLNIPTGDPECIVPLKVEVIDLFESIAARSEDALAGNASILNTLDDNIGDLEDEYARLLDEIDAPCGPAGGGQ